MSFRIRVLLAFLPVALVPLIVFGFGARDVARERLTEQYQRRVETLASGIRDDLRRRSDDVDRRLAALRDEAVADNRLRRALLGVRAERSYLLDYASGAMRLAGLDMLLLQNDRGRVMSSGHFRNEFDRFPPAVHLMLQAVPGGMALVRVRAPDGLGDGAGPRRQDRRAVLRPPGDEHVGRGEGHAVPEPRVAAQREHPRPAAVGPAPRARQSRAHHRVASHLDERLVQLAEQDALGVGARRRGPGGIDRARGGDGDRIGRRTVTEIQHARIDDRRGRRRSRGRAAGSQGDEGDGREPAFHGEKISSHRHGLSRSPVTVSRVSR